MQSIRRLAYFYVMFAVVFGSVGLVLLPMTAHAAAAVSVNNGTINANFPGAPVPASSGAIEISRLSVTSSSADQTLTSVQANFSGTGFTTADLAALATGATSGVALYNDTGLESGSFDSGDAVLTLGSVPSFSGNNIVLTPAVSPALVSGTGVVFHLVIKTSATISNNDLIEATIPINGVVTTNGNGPVAAVTLNNLRADTLPAQISSVTGSTTSNTLAVRFSKPVQKVLTGALTASDFT